MHQSKISAAHNMEHKFDDSKSTGHEDGYQIRHAKRTLTLPRLLALPALMGQLKRMYYLAQIGWRI